MIYYSARLHVVSILESKAAAADSKYICDYPFVVFRAADDEAAYERALALGMDQEHEYENGDGELVRWRFRAVEQIWRLGNDVEGKEVGSILDVYEPDGPLDFRRPFSPETVKPIISDWDC